MNGMGRAARDGCVIVDMQSVHKVKTIRRLMEDLRCVWLQVDVGGGGWGSCDAPVVVDDGYVAAGISGVGELCGSGGTVGRPHVPPVALSLRRVAEELGVLVSDDESGSDSDIDM